MRAVPREASRGTAPFTHLTRRPADSCRFAPLAADATVRRFYRTATSGMLVV